MIDLFRLAIPFDESFVVGGVDKSGRLSGLVNLLECGLRGAKLAAGSVTNNDGQIDYEDLFCPYESLPSSLSSLAFKIHQGGPTYWPFVEIKASPAKLLQGHNVFGSDDVRLCLEALVTTFTLGMPRLSEMLDFKNTELKQIDCTFSAQLPNESVSRNVVHALRNISSGQTRSSKSAHATTAYWGIKSSKGGKNSRRKQLKAYLKHFELQKCIEDAKAKYKKTKDEIYLNQLNAMQSPEVIKFAENALRFEASVMPRTLARLGFPTRMGDFVERCENFKVCPIAYLWNEAWQDIFSTFEGAQMNIYDDEQVRKALRKQFVSTRIKEIKSGRHIGKHKTIISYAKADRLFRFFRSLKSEGWEEVKLTTAKNTFYDNIKLLTQVVSKAHLQNLHSIASNVVPLVQFINVDFAKQHPENWQEPKPLHEQLNNLRLVG